MRSFQLANSPLSAYHGIAVLVDTDEKLLRPPEPYSKVSDCSPEARLALMLQAGNDLHAAMSASGR